MGPHMQEQEHKHQLPLWVRLAIVVFVLLLTAVGVVLGIIAGSTGAVIATVLFGVLGVLLALVQLLPSLFPSGRLGHSKMLLSQLTSNGQHASPAPLLFQPAAPPTQTFPAGITSPPQNPTATTSRQHEQAAPDTAMSGPKVDWGQAPHVGQFYGRAQELAELKQWIVSDRCRVVAVLGIGGIGKTTLAAQLAEQIIDQFEYVFWRSLQNAPPLENILKNCIQCFSNQQRIDLPGDIDGQITVLVEYLRAHRCLLALDNLETILQAGNRAGQYREGYEAYSRLLTRIGEGKHQSSLLLTSREKPKELAQLEGKTAPVRVLLLAGLEQAEGHALLKDKGLLGSEETWAELIHLYSGNPLALKLVSEPIRDVFGGDVARFLKKGEAVIGDISDLLNQQFARLSELEREIMYWLAIEREAVSLDELHDDIVHPMAKGALLEALRSLLRRSLVESSGTAGFTLQPVILEYVTDRFVERVAEEIETETIELFGSHALIKVQTKDYVRESQDRLILTPLAERLFGILGKAGVEKKLEKMLSTLREATAQRAGYAAGNVLNLLIHLQSDLRGYDFSHLTVRQAYLRNAFLPEANFAYADLTSSVFTDTFGIIAAVAFSPDGELLAAGTGDGEVHLWQAATGMPLRTLKGLTDWVWCISFSPDGRILASGGSDQNVRLWEVSTGQLLANLQEHTNRIRAIAFSPTGRILASAGEDQTIRLWDASTFQSLSTLQGHTKPVRAIAFSPDGGMLVSSGDDRAIRMWDLQTGQCLKILEEAHSRPIWSIAFSPTGIIASGSDDKTLKLWESQTGQRLKVLEVHTGWICSLAFSSDGRLLASGSADGTVRLWEVNTGECISTLEGHSNWVNSVAFSPDDRTLASGSHDRTVRMWEVSSGHCLNTLHGYTNAVRSIAFSPKDKLLASGSEDRTIRLWEVDTGQCLHMLQGYANRITSVAFSPDGRLLATGGDGPESIRRFNPVYHPDRRFLAAGSDIRSIQLWEVSTGQCLNILQGHTDGVKSVVFSPKGNLLASGSTDWTVRVWEVSTGQCLNILQGHSGWIRSVGFSPKGNLLASGSEDKTIRLWEVKTGRCLHILQGHTNRVRAVAFSPNGKLLASGSPDETVRLWEVSTGRCFKVLQEDAHGVMSVAFSPSGRVLASGGVDQTVRLWEINSGQCFLILQGHTSWVRSVAFSLDGQTLASSSQDGTIKLWDTQTGGCVKTLRSERPYERMNITSVTGLTEAQKATLKALGAIEDEGEERISHSSSLRLA
jgi:WD40 repeat protein